MSSGFSFDDYLLALHRCSPSAVRQNIVNAFPLFEIRPELLAVVINRLEWRKAIAAYDVARVQKSHILTHEHHREYTKALCFSGNWLWAMMHASKDVKDRERIDCAIMCCGNSGQWRRAMKLLFKSQELTEKAGPSPVHGEATWLNATRIAVQASPFSKALREGIVRSLLSMRNTVAIASIVLTATQKWSATTIHNHPTNSSFAPTREEMHALLAISNDALLPQLHSFNASIQWSHVLKLASTFLSQGFGRTHNVLQSLINALDIRGRWVECLETVTWYRKQASISLLHESFMIPIWTSRALPEAGKSVVLILHVYKKALESRGPQFARPLGIMAARACDDLQAPGIANEIRQTITPYSRKRILRVKQCKN